jgi:hypothetical protein
MSARRSERAGGMRKVVIPVFVCCAAAGRRSSNLARSSIVDTHCPSTTDSSVPDEPSPIEIVGRLDRRLGYASNVGPRNAGRWRRRRGVGLVGCNSSSKGTAASTTAGSAGRRRPEPAERQRRAHRRHQRAERRSASRTSRSHPSRSPSRWVRPSPLPTTTAPTTRSPTAAAPSTRDPSLPPQPRP